MPVSCLLSHTYHDLRCPVCGEGFLLLAAEMPTGLSRILLKRKAGEALRAQHTEAGALNVHPAEAFELFLDDHAVVEFPSLASPFQVDAEPVAVA